MSRAFDRTLKSVKQQLLPKREPPPDFTGWKDTDVVMWRLNNGVTLQEMVREANVGWEKQRKRMEAKAKRERERRADEGDARMAAYMAAMEPKPAPKAEPEAPEPGQPKPEPQWWEERARWRERGPEDYEWDERKPRPGMCLVEYDPMGWDDEED
jgi:hypothetical protein